MIKEHGLGKEEVQTVMKKGIPATNGSRTVKLWEAKIFRFKNWTFAKYELVRCHLITIPYQLYQRVY
jgi:hypothetical protein